jgi:hypothetical protein
LLKGGLHSHSTRSDGEDKPEEVIRHYYANGYDFMALTDHRVYNYENFAPECPITIIPGTEYDNTFAYDDYGFRTWHHVCIGPSREDGNGFEQDQRLKYPYVYDQESFQPVLNDIHAKKNLTIYCHPEWSSTPPRFFEKLQGNFAMEIWNSGSALWFDRDTNAAYWDDLLGQGKKIWGVATDDGHAMHSHCKGWVRVRAENNIPAILKALEDGAFYSSCGPEFYDFYVENNIVHVDCSPAKKVFIVSDRHPALSRAANGAGLTHAEFDLSVGTYGKKFRYVRAVVIDEQGNRAWTNPIFLD